MEHGTSGTARSTPPEDDAGTAPGAVPARVGAVHPAMQSAFAALQGAGLSWCLLRGERRLDCLDGDVDILVDPLDLTRVPLLLEDLGFRPIRGVTTGTHEGYQRHLPSEGQRLKLDFVTELGFGPGCAYLAPVAAPCLARTMAHGEVRVLHPTDAFWALLLHRLLDKGSVRARDVDDLARLVPEPADRGPIDSLLSDLWPSGWDGRAVVQCVQRSEAARLKALGPQLAAAWRRKDPVTVYRRQVQGQLRRVARRLLPAG